MDVEALLIKLQVVFRMRHALAGASMPNAISLSSQIAREVTAEHRLKVASVRAAFAGTEETLLRLLRTISYINKDWSRRPLLSTVLMSTILMQSPKFIASTEFHAATKHRGAAARVRRDAQGA